jgi:purine-binding chemotaxis protein CheW
MQHVSNSTNAAPMVRLATFTVGDLFFGIEVTRVQEVLRLQRMTAVPQAPNVIEGLINLRGQIVTAIDMRCRLNLPPRPADQEPMNVVVRTADGPVSFLVDEIGDVMEMDSAAFDYPPDNLESTARQVIRGVYKLPERLLLVIDEEQAAEVAVAA